MTKNYQEELVEMVKAAGQDLIDRADDLVGTAELITDFDIWLRFPQVDQLEPPTIKVQKSVVARNAFDVMIGDKPL